MTTHKTKRETVDIDENFLLQSIKEQDSETDEKVKPAPPPQEVSEPVPDKPTEGKEPSKRKRNVNADYGTLFLRRNDFRARQCVYISQRIHATISEIVKVISDKDVTVGGYIDTILTEHLETHRDEITELYNSELSKKSGKSLMEF
jgi:hypothetical protein